MGLKHPTLDIEVEVLKRVMIVMSSMMQRILRYKQAFGTVLEVEVMWMRKIKLSIIHVVKRFLPEKLRVQREEAVFFQPQLPNKTVETFTKLQHQSQNLIVT